ncbi:histidine triad nucleotide-binding protein [Patescibacteria group bacterium]|nr:histidine triad nucleotide-binding protein [Patescibacteria group bacterium]MBU1890687.1 histidine triad nucleotide-binding protein [Patescibacteria group bacterium]
MSQSKRADCIFCKIVDKQMPAKVVHEDDRMIAFHDIQPKAKTHVLLIPKKHIESLADVSKEDVELMGELMIKIKEVAIELGVEKSFNVVVNNGSLAGQIIPHLHFHILSGWSGREKV